jgi:hypothetical protein
MSMTGSSLWHQSRRNQPHRRPHMELLPSSPRSRLRNVLYELATHAQQPSKFAQRSSNNRSQHSSASWSTRVKNWMPREDKMRTRCASGHIVASMCFMPAYQKDVDNEEVFRNHESLFSEIICLVTHIIDSSADESLGGRRSV